MILVKKDRVDFSENNPIPKTFLKVSELTGFPKVIPKFGNKYFSPGELG